MRYFILTLILFVASSIHNENQLAAIAVTYPSGEFVPMNDDAFLKWKQTASLMDIGLLVFRHSEQLILSEIMTNEASELLLSSDLFVRAAAEWAISLRVGNENKNDEAIWPKKENPEWFTRWYNIPLSDRIEMDWCRQVIASGIYDKPDKLIDQIGEMNQRIHLQLQNNSFRERDKEMVENTCRTLDELQNKASSIVGNDKSIVAIQKYWLKARRLLRPVVFSNKTIDFDSVIFFTRFAPHHKPNVCGILHNGTYKPGGDITIIKGLVRVDSVRTVIGERLPKGHIHGMDLHFDGKKVVFGYGKQLSWPPPREAHYNNISSWGTELRQSLEPVSLYEMDIDGSDLKRLTSHPVWSDTEPVYCPNDDVAFSSERSAHSAVCDYEFNDVSDVNLYLFERENQTIRRLTNHRDIDMTPRLLNNGLLAYMRWEYQERNFNEIHSVWTIHPDGTYPDALYKQHIPRPYALREARSVPNSNKLVAIAAGHHCYSRGPIILVDPQKGGNNPDGMENLTPGIVPQEATLYEKTQPVKFGGVKEFRGYYKNPYPVSESVILASYSYSSEYCNPYKGEILDYKTQVESNGFGIYLIDSYGNKELIYRDPIYCCEEVFPLKKHKRPVVTPDLVSKEKNFATCIISNIYEGISPEVEPGSIKYIRISQHLPEPFDENGRARKFAFGSKFGQSLPGVTRWTAVREIGLVPVEEDGSAYFMVPIADNASVYFQALDKNFMELIRMRSSVSFQPGEVRSCTGCHETQINRAPFQSSAILALKREAVMPGKPVGGYTPFDFEMMVQPIFDKKCIQCHSGNNIETKLDLTGKKISVQKSPEKFNQSYISILGPSLLGKDKESLVALNDRFSDGSITKPKQFGSHKSKFTQKLLKEHHGVKLTRDEWYALVTWVDYNAPYHGKLINKYPRDGSPPRREEWVWPDPWQCNAAIPALYDYRLPTNISQDTTLITGDRVTGKVLRYGLDGSLKWEFDADSVSDIHLLQNGNILLTAGNTVKEVDRSARTIMKFRNSGELSSCQPLSNGNTLVSDKKNSRILVLDRRMQFLREIPLKIKHKGQNCIEKVRVGPKGTYFVAYGADKIVGEYDEKGTLLRSIPFENDVYAIVPMNNGDIIVGGTGGIQIVNQNDSIIWSLKSDDIPEVNLQTVKDLIMLPNGNLVIVNKTENSIITKGVKLFEVNRNKMLVQTFGKIENQINPSCIALSGVTSNLFSESK
jgi:hypothetical protein